MKPLSTEQVSRQPVVLYVEDEDDNWNVTELRLSAKFQLLHARSDQEAIALVRKLGNTIHAVLMDIQLQGSGLDGIQLTKLFCGRYEGPPLPAYAKDCPVIDAPVLFVTAYGARYTEEELKRAGAMAMVSKPVDFVQLTLALASARAKRALEVLAKTPGLEPK